MHLTAGGYLSFYMPDKRSNLELVITTPKSLRTLLEEIGIPLQEVQLVLLNGRIVDLEDAVVGNQDEVRVYSPIDGG